MFKKILCGVDGSDASTRAAEVAAQLAAKFGGELIILTVAKELKITPAVKRYLDAEHITGGPQYVLEQYVESAMKAGVDAARAGGAVKVREEVRSGPPARTIVDVAKHEKCDCIVLGSRGLGDMGSILLGSVSHKVTSLAACTVVTVR